MKDIFVIVSIGIVILYIIINIVIIVFSCLRYYDRSNHISLEILKEFMIKIIASCLITFFLTRFINIDLSNDIINYSTDLFGNRFLGIVGSLYLGFPLGALDETLSGNKWNENEWWFANVHFIFLAYQMWFVTNTKYELYYELKLD